MLRQGGLHSRCLATTCVGCTILADQARLFCLLAVCDCMVTVVNLLSISCVSR